MLTDNHTAAYRGAGGFWRGNYSDQQLATPGAFRADPCLVWQFYEDRRAKARAAEPHAAHFALVALAKTMGSGMLSVNQNVDGRLYLDYESVELRCSAALMCCGPSQAFVNAPTTPLSTLLDSMARYSVSAASMRTADLRWTRQMSQSSQLSHRCHQQTPTTVTMLQKPDFLSISPSPETIFRTAPVARMIISSVPL